MNCIYCGANSYGTPCIFSPTNTHLHADEGDKCVYCGSKNLGSGCPFNPYGQNHVRAGTVFMQVQEQLRKSSVLSHIFEMLVQKNNKSYNSPLDRMYKRMADTIKKLSEPLLEAFSLSEMPILENLNSKQKEEADNIKNILTEQLSDLRSTLKYANTALPTEIVEKLLTSAILNSGENV